MITRHHFVLGLLCAVIPGTALAEYDPGLAIVLTVAVCTGVLLPDIHMTRPRQNSPRTLAWGIVQAGRLICVSPMCTAYRRLPAAPFDPRDKRLTHSLTGIFWYSAVYAGIAGISVALTGNHGMLLPAVIFGLGLIAGMFLHLIQDLCTRKGIVPFFPFSTTKICGSIRPCDIFDRRIFRFHVWHGLVLSLFLIIVYTTPMPVFDLLACAGIALCACIGYLPAVSEVIMERGSSADGRAPDTVMARKA